MNKSSKIDAADYFNIAFIECESSGLQMIDEDTYATKLDIFVEPDSGDYYIQLGVVDVVYFTDGKYNISGLWSFETYGNEHGNVMDLINSQDEEELIKLVMRNELSTLPHLIFRDKQLVRELARLNKKNELVVKNAELRKSEYDTSVHFRIKGSGVQFTYILPKKNKRVSETLLMHTDSIGTTSINLELYGLDKWEDVKEQIYSYPKINLKMILEE